MRTLFSALRAYLLRNAIRGRRFLGRCYRFGKGKLRSRKRLQRRILHITDTKVFTRHLAFELAEHGRTGDLLAILDAYRSRAPELNINLFTKLVSVVDITTTNDPRITLTPREESKPYTFTEPKIFEETVSGPSRTLAVPRQWIAEVKNVSVIGSFQVIADDDLLLYEPAANPQDGFVAGIWPYVTRVNDESGKACLWFVYKNRVRLDKGILISGRCSPNYFHCLIEYFIRIFLVNPLPELHDIPLILDAGLFPQEKEIVQLLFPEWPVYYYDHHTTLLDVGTLYIPSVMTNHPDRLDAPLWQGSTLSESALLKMRHRTLERLGITLDTPPTRKIFLARRKGRNIVNAAEVEAIMADAGYEIVDTGTLSFAEQVRLFASASHLAGPMGAAFSNLIFCHPDCQVLAMVTPFGKNFCMQSNLAQCIGCDYTVLSGTHPAYIRGAENSNRDLNLLHDAFSIDIAQLRRALRE